MKIALLKCSGSLNVGNEFINAGGIYLIQTLFPDATFFEYEFFDSAVSAIRKYQSSALLEWTKKEIENECDIMFVFCGCIFSKFAESILNEISKITVKKYLLGAGAYQYDDFEKDLCLNISRKFDGIFTRDDITYSYFRNAENVFSGIDLAFFVKDSLNCFSESKSRGGGGGYALINLDLLEGNKKETQKQRDKFLKKFKDVFIIENTTTPHRETKGFLQIGYWDTLWKTISHADFVLTNRIHTAVCCLSNCVPFAYDGWDAGESAKRASLFFKIGFTLERGRIYDAEFLEESVAPLVDHKNNMLNALRQTIQQNNQ